MNAPSLLLLPSLLGGASPADDAIPSTEITRELVVAVERGLAYLASTQQPDGSWLGDVGYKLNVNYNVVLENAPHLGTSALALMAFMAGGHLPGRGRYGDTVNRALDWILSCAQDSGYVRANDSRMYDHAFATLALAEVYGMTSREDVRAKLQRAIDLIVQSQNTEGGWRYEPFAPDSDLSITVCQVMALRSARNIGIRVPKGTIDRAVAYVERSAVREGPVRGTGFDFDARGSFRYQPQMNSRSSWPLTAAGLVTLFGAGVYLGEDIEEGLEYLAKEQAQFSYLWGQQKRGHYFYWYGHYYAVQAMFIAGGDRWESYFASVREQLLRLQLATGAWENATGPGPNFATAVATLVLQIPYRYLPIFQR
jgi:hypothetical protein